MRKLTLLFIVTSIVLACGTPKTVQESKKVIKGIWTLDEVTYSEEGNFLIQLLSDTSKECFLGSTWRFIPNNNTGVYAINGADCPTGDRHFIFVIQEVDQTTGLYDFLLKPTNEKKKSETNVGFRLHLTQLTNDKMKWEQTVSLEGKPFTIVMNFTKTEE
jgi:hypothetical protein